MITGIFWIFLFLGKDTSSAGHTHQEISSDNRKNGNRGAEDGKVQKLLESGKSLSQEYRTRNRSSKIYKEPTKYKAAQVIEREGIFDREKTIPQGTNMIGKLLTSIDTREAEQSYKVFLPYGGSFKEGASIPKGSTLFGKIRYSGKGRKVFMTFSKGIYPDGREFTIQAQALNSKDYSPGITGDFHGKSGARVASTLGLSVVSGAASFLMDRDQRAPTGVNTPNLNLKNALHSGISQAAQSEAQRQAQIASEQQEYVTVDAGKDLIINLTKGYNEQ